MSRPRVLAIAWRLASEGFRVWPRSIAAYARTVSPAWCATSSWVRAAPRRKFRVFWARTLRSARNCTRQDDAVAAVQTRQCTSCFSLPAGRAKRSIV